MSKLLVFITILTIYMDGSNLSPLLRKKKYLKNQKIVETVSCKLNFFKQFPVELVKEAENVRSSCPGQLS